MSQLILENEFIDITKICDISDNTHNLSPKNKTPSDGKRGVTKINKPSIEELNYTNFFKSNMTLTKYKIPELKAFAKKNNMHISGTKQVLIDRITMFFIYTKNAIIIQRRFKGWMVRLAFSLHGTALKNRALCVNDTDFVTMEPIKDIELSHFFSFTDAKQFTYGFDIESLVHSVHKLKQTYNPYTREKLDGMVIANIITFYKLSLLIYPTVKNTVSSTGSVSNRPSTTRRSSTHVRNVNTPAANYNITTEVIASRIRILELRRLPIEQRIQNLFMEIAVLTNF